MIARDVGHHQTTAKCFSVVAKFEDEPQSRGGVCNWVKMLGYFLANKVAFEETGQNVGLATRRTYGLIPVSGMWAFYKPMLHTVLVQMLQNQLQYSIFFSS